MARKRWEGKTGFGQLSRELALADGRDFQRKALSFLRAVWPEAHGTPDLRRWDRAGADHLVWAAGERLPLVVQCKGFQVREHEMGRDQARQCVASIEKFALSGLKTDCYVLTHNRETRSREFTETVAKALSDLLTSGAATEVELLDRKALIKRAFDAIFDRLVFRLREGSLHRIDDLLALEPPLVAPLEEVPLAEHRIVWNRNFLMSMEQMRTFIGDPTEHVAQHEQGICLVLGEFGQGKTTTVLRGARDRPGHVLVVPAATFTPQTTSTRSLLTQCVDLEQVIREFPEEDQAVIQQIARPCLDSALTDERIDIALVLDGIDESVFFSRRQGLQHLFNLLEDTRVPVTVTCRTEFWNARRSDFATAAGPLPRTPESRRRRNLKVIELLPWTNTEIGRLAERFKQTLIGTERANLEALLVHLEAEGFESLYGDIPRRPLFLRMILESVAAMGLHGTDKARLVEEWLVVKIARDRNLPIIKGGAGRQPIVSESETLDAEVDLVLRAMESAAAAMTQVHDDVIELLPSCQLEQAMKTNDRLQHIVDPTGLFLHSVLMPLAKMSSVEPTEVRFAHRSLQEYFLARAIRQGVGGFHSRSLPAEVTEWLDIMGAGTDGT